MEIPRRCPVTADTLAAGTLDSLCHVGLARLSDQVYCLPFPNMKIIPARHMIESAYRSGELHADSHVVETTSGTLGLGLALVCREYGLPLTLVTDAVVDLRLRMRLEYLGVRVEIVDQSGQAIQQARLDRVREILASDSARYYWPRQYDNPANRESYAPLARSVQDRLGRVDIIVGSVGSGGSTCGIAEAIRERTGQARLVGIDTHGSILFGLAPGSRKLRGLGNSILPKNLLHRSFDEVHWLPAHLAHGATRALYRDHGLYMGPTSGATYLVGQHVAARYDGARVLLIFPDDGNRYADEVYSEQYLGASEPPAGAAPRFVTHPREVKADEWAALAWCRRSLAEVTRAPADQPGEAGQEKEYNR